MKKWFRAIMLILIFTFIYSQRASAGSGIVIDGRFEDWTDKPYVTDYTHDIKSPWYDFTELRYFADDKYLYLDVQRLSSNKSQPWSFHVVILNALKGQKLPQCPSGKLVYAPQFDITSSYSDNKSHSGTVVTVSFNGENIESTFSGSNDNKETEFRVPLNRVGLDGVNKSLQFILKSDIDAKTTKHDWIPNGSPILITTGPTGWQLSSAALFIGVSFLTYKIYKRDSSQ